DARVLPDRSAFSRGRDGLDARGLAGRELALEIEGGLLLAALEPGPSAGEFFLVVDGARERIFLATQNDVHFIHWRGLTHRVTAWNALDRVREQAKRSGGAEEIRAPMPGVVVSIAVAVGEAVETGSLLLTIESMKLQTAISASHPARVAELCVAAGENFDQGAPLVRLEPLGSPDSTNAAGAATAAEKATPESKTSPAPTPSPSKKRAKR
ncbi:biotin/lipoyl-binding protein, partial [Myxococcota bacterium]|nr:biotin/lipoyl-binding protein [Myxococcota bacterium]